MNISVNPAGATKRLLLAFLAVCALICTATVVLPASGAQAAPLAQHAFTFTDPKGTDWQVPAGVDEVLVSIRGGKGGEKHSSQPGGDGMMFVLQVPVMPGQVLTVYAGHSAPTFSRTAGLGFVNGGRGGDKSKSARVGNGGGGAAALKIDSELVAVAGGGGGGGGAGGDREFRPFNYDFDFGGAGGDAVSGDKPGWGEGKHAGNPGKNGVNDPKFAQYHKSGQNGPDAGFMTSGGGGGAGGGGWPSSGTAGGAGKKKLGFGAGSGGGAGMSWVAEDVPGLMVLEQGHGPFAWENKGPQAAENTVKITIPLHTETVISAPSTVTAGNDFEIVAQSFARVNQEQTIDGSFELLVGDTVIASGVTDGAITVPVAALPEGEHLLSYRFTATHDMGQYWNQAAVSAATVMVKVLPAGESLEQGSTVDSVLEQESAGDGGELGGTDELGNTSDSENLDEEICVYVVPEQDNIVNAEVLKQ